MMYNTPMTNTTIMEFFKRPIAYQPLLGKAFESVNLGILWSQLYYWTDKTKDGWIYKTHKDIYKETGLSRREQDTARKIGRKLGVLEEKLAGCPATLNFKVNIEQAIKIIEIFLEKQNSGQAPLFKEPKKHTGSISYLRALPEADIKELAEKFFVDFKFVKDRAEDVIDYCEAKGKSYSNYKAALRNFIKTHIEKNPQSVIAMRQAQKNKQQEELQAIQDKKDIRTPAEQARVNKRLADLKKNLKVKLSM